MRKLTLNLDQLTVDSFDTEPSDPARGTVMAAQCTCYTVCTCPGYGTCDTCGFTCVGDCSQGGKCLPTDWECTGGGASCDPFACP